MNLRLLWLISSMNLRKQMSYRTDFWFSSLAVFAIHFTIIYYVWKAVFRESGRSMVAGFTFGGLIFYYLLVMLLNRITRGREGVAIASQEIYDGGLTKYLVYPIWYFPFKFAGRIGDLIPVGLQAVVLCTLIVLILGIPQGFVLTPATISMALVSIVLANVLSFLMIVCIEMVAFWADNVWALNTALRMTTSVLGGMMFPISLYPEWFLPVVKGLPFQYTLYFPAAILLGRIDMREWIIGTLITLGWCGFMSLAVRAVWLRGTREYAGVGI